MGGRLLALIALKVIKILAFLAKHENSFDVPGVACGAPASPKLSLFTGASYHAFVRARRAAAVDHNIFVVFSGVNLLDRVLFE